MKHIKSKRLLENNENKIRWSTYNFVEADEYLKESFIDFINPIDDRIPATVTTTQVGHDLMVFWIISIPIFKSNRTAFDIKVFSSMITSLLEEIDECLDQAKSKLDMRHNVGIESNNLKVTIWSHNNER